MRGLFALISPRAPPPPLFHMQARSAKMCEVTQEKHFTSTNLFPCELLSYTLTVGFNPSSSSGEKGAKDAR